MLKLPGAVVSGSVIYLTTEVCGRGQPRDVGNDSVFFLVLIRNKYTDKYTVVFLIYTIEVNGHHNCSVTKNPQNICKKKSHTGLE